MFGRGRRKARTTQPVESQVEAPQPLFGMVADQGPEAAAVVTVEVAPVAALERANIELDVEFVAMMAQLDDSLAAMARACDRIEQVVAGASRHHPVDGVLANVEAAAAA